MPGESTGRFCDPPHSPGEGYCHTQCQRCPSTGQPHLSTTIFLIYSSRSKLQGASHLSPPHDQPDRVPRDWRRNGVPGGTRVIRRKTSRGPGCKIFHTGGAALGSPSSLPSDWVDEQGRVGAPWRAATRKWAAAGPARGETPGGRATLQEPK